MLQQMCTKSCLFISLCFIASHAQQYEPTWESLDKRPIPEWFSDAKFGIFIHWGLYSVPAWSPKGTYSEWYQHFLERKSIFGKGDFQGDEVFKYHEKTYGKNVSYYDLGKRFTVDLFKPDDWANLFKKAGAKYVVLTSKHHDGFTLWPSKEANDRGFLWNSVAVGAHRDLVGALSEAVKKKNLKMGLYYSLYEWFHPWWLTDKKRFVEAHYLPQIKDLVTRYKPDILWPDGEWEMDVEQWQSKAFLAWLYNDSPVKQTILVNDRWGKGTRKKHGGYFSTEYEASVKLDKPWEECRGMGFSFGYNRHEDIEDYNSPKALILTLVDIVSAGGNLLLDIGPDGRGRIPVIMQERLLQIGAWLKTNGEAIYKTRPWHHSVQWSSEGKRHDFPNQHELGSNLILKQTVDPIPGYAIKELFFTQNKDAYFVILPKWYDKQVVIRNFMPHNAPEITLLATGESLKGRQSKTDFIIAMPSYNPNTIKTPEAYVIKIKKHK